MLHGVGSQHTGSTTQLIQGIRVDERLNQRLGHGVVECGDLLKRVDPQAVQIFIDLRVAHTETGCAELQGDRGTHFRLPTVEAMLVHGERLWGELAGVGHQAGILRCCDAKRDAASEAYQILVVDHALVAGIEHRASHVEHGLLPCLAVQIGLEGGQLLQPRRAGRIGRELIQCRQNCIHRVVVEIGKGGVEGR